MKNLILLLIAFLGYNAASGQGLEVSVNAGSYNGATLGYNFGQTSLSAGIHVMSIGMGGYIQGIYRPNWSSDQLDGYLEFGIMARRDYMTRNLGTLGEISSTESGIHVILGTGLWLDRYQKLGLGFRLYPGLTNHGFKAKASATLIVSL